MTDLPQRAPGHAHAVERQASQRYRQGRVIGRARVPEQPKPTEEYSPSPLLRSMGDRVEAVGGVSLTRGTVLRLLPGDYFYETEWINPRRRPVVLVVTWTGETAEIGGEQYLYIDGMELIDNGQPQARSVAVRIAVLPRVLRSQPRGI